MTIDPPLPGQRQVSYNIGGAPPYGFSGTSLNNAQWVPAIDQSVLGNEVALYERNDWDAIKGPASLVNQYQNPAFIGVGNTGQMPGWMQGSRILRGYARRLDYVDFSIPSLSPDDAARNTRLFFMFNPTDITRQYLSYADTAGIKSLDTTDQINADTQAFTTTTVSLDLLFDRGEEVARIHDHPGVLVDLAVFDMLAGQMPFTKADLDMLTKKFENTQTAGGKEAAASATADYLQSSRSLMVDTSMRLAFVMSPNLMFQGTIQSASALFQKFSHRMTPTRMVLSLTLLITYTGQQFDAGLHDPNVAAAADWTTQHNAAVAAVDPSKVHPATKAAADELNSIGRQKAVDWGYSWTAPAMKKQNLGNSTYPWGVLYLATARDSNWKNDNFGLREAAINSPDGINHQPGAFDCSSFVYRCYNVVDGWIQALGFVGGVNDMYSDTFVALATNPGDNRWGYLDLGDAEGSQRADAFNYWSVPDAERHQSGSNRHGPDRGDILVKMGGHYGSGAGNAGHVAMIESFQATNADPWSWQWTLISSHTPAQPVEIQNYTTRQIIEYPFNWLIRPGPIQS